MKIAMVGDTHGNYPALNRILRGVAKHKITHVFVLGDFGLWSHTASGVEFLDNVNGSAERNKCSIFAIGGNHENWDHWNWYVENLPTHKGFAMVRRRVLLAPKVHSFKLSGTQFVAAGGAVSIDKSWRLKEEAQTYSPKGKPRAHTLWWPDEQLTDADVHKVRNMQIRADVLLTHDCSNHTPFKYRLKPDADSVRHRERIDEVLRLTQPDVHFHGHMHTKYDWVNNLAHRSSVFDVGSKPIETRTYGLECDTDVFNWGVFDTDTRTFSWLGE